MGKKERPFVLFACLNVGSGRREGREVSEAHNTPHLRNVAALTKRVGSLYDFTEQELLLSYASGWLHDLVRSPSEDPSVGDDEATVKVARRFLEAANERRIFTTTQEEREAIFGAIEKHGSYPGWLADPRTREREPQTLEEKVWLALFVADKMEANGVRVIARRSSFVAGHRLKSEKGDWQKFGFEPGKDEGLVVAIESILRLTFLNPEYIYPEKLGLLVHPLYETQREFVAALFKALNLTVKDAASLLLESKNSKGRNILEVRKIEAPSEVGELTRLIEREGITTEKINNVLDDLEVSAQEAVEYFSDHYQEDLGQLIANWSPKGIAAQEWQRAMVE